MANLLLAGITFGTTKAYTAGITLGFGGVNLGIQYTLSASMGSSLSKNASPPKALPNEEGYYWALEIVAATFDVHGQKRTSSYVETTP